MYNMDKELLEFVEWLPNNSELFADLDLEASIAQINELASSEEGKQTLEQLTNQYKNKDMELFKKGGKLDYLLCLKKGGSVDCGCKKMKNGGENNIPIRMVRKETPDLSQIVLQPMDGSQADTTLVRNGQTIVSPHGTNWRTDLPEDVTIPSTRTWNRLNQETASVEPMYDGGGKVAKAASGTIIDGDWNDYHTTINAPGDTLRFKQYFSGPAYMQTHPEGGVTYERSTRDGVIRMYGNGYQPSWWERNVLGYQPVTAEEQANWEQLIKNHANDPAVKDKTKRKGVLELLGISKIK